MIDAGHDSCLWNRFRVVELGARSRCGRGLRLRGLWRDGMSIGWLNQGVRLCWNWTDTIEHAVIEAEERQFQTICYSKLVIDLAEIILDDLFGRAHPQSNLFVFHALGYAGNDERLFGGERNFGTRAGGTRALCTIGLHHPCDGPAF